MFNVQCFKFVNEHETTNFEPETNLLSHSRLLLAHEVGENINVQTCHKTAMVRQVISIYTACLRFSTSNRKSSCI